MNTKRISSGHITKLNKHEIFVFGSNKQGHHGGGAAAFAFMNFGAKVVERGEEDISSHCL